MFAIALAAPAFSAECAYVSYREGLVAVDAGDGYDIFNSTGGAVDHCSSEPGEITRYSHCKGGWEGSLFFAGADNLDASPQEIMVLQNDVWFCRPMPKALTFSPTFLGDLAAHILDPALSKKAKR